VYLLLYGIVLGFILLTLKGQKIRLEKKLALQAEIAEYQIKTIKNQVDPHFVFNAINTISSLMLTDDKLKADEFICKFSDLMRKTLEYSDKITCTLQEEIEYVEKFIQLQQIRFNNSFQYKIEVDESVQKNTIVPKHVLYSYVENAIKHSLTSVEKGLLSISIFYETTQLVLQIEDNGSGFKKGTKKNSTGNGILIMEKIYLLYSKLYQKKIKHQINEIFNTKDKVIGVSVKVFISK
jgi:LytS/YehU family sensor histidine kinase